MNQQNTVQDTKPKPRVDDLKWLLIIFLLTGGILANFYYAHVVAAIRASVGIVLTILVLVIASQTQRGQEALGFMKGSRTELRKVVWPSRQEIVHTTLVVVVMVITIALVLCGLDSFFMWAIIWVTGRG